MTLAELKKLVSQGEGLHVEFKRKVAEPLKVLREVVAFANKSGGKLLIGVDDNGNLAGLKYAQEEKFILEKALVEHCFPKIRYETQSIEVAPQRQVMIFTIFESPKKPVYLNPDPKKKKGKAYIRVADKSVQVSKEVRKILKASSIEKEVSGFTYGENERMAIKHLALYGSTNVRKFAEETQIPYALASDVLVRLTVHNVLEVHPNEHGDFFTVKEYVE
ncbi:MAG: ATP-binding protein [Flammeovirgaceae bacterium]